MELGGVYESFGSFEGALHIYQRIASSMPLLGGFEDVLFRCAVVMRYMSTLEVSRFVCYSATYTHFAADAPCRDKMKE